MFSHQVDENVELRLFEDSHAEEIFDLVKDNYDHLRPFLQFVTPEYSLDNAKEFIENSKKSLAENKNQSFGIFYQKN